MQTTLATCAHGLHVHREEVSVFHSTPYPLPPPPPPPTHTHTHTYIHTHVPSVLLQRQNALPPLTDVTRLYVYNNLIPGEASAATIRVPESHTTSNQFSVLCYCCCCFSSLSPHSLLFFSLSFCASFDLRLCLLGLCFMLRN